MEVLYVGPVDSDGAEQARVVDDVVARGVDAIAISCDDPTACIDPINRAVAAGIPVMTWDSRFSNERTLHLHGIGQYQGRARWSKPVSSSNGEPKEKWQS